MELKGAIPFAALVAIALMGLLAWRSMEPSVAISVPSSAVAFSSPPSVATFPPELIQAAIAQSTFMAPTMTPTPKPQTPTSTPHPRPLFCPDDPNVLPNGTVCRGTEPLPTPTVMPACLVPPTPGIDCEVRYSRVGMATPIPAFGR